MQLVVVTSIGKSGIRVRDAEPGETEASVKGDDGTLVDLDRAYDNPNMEQLRQAILAYLKIRF